ncbi:MAG TPA: hypothetical protein VNB29_03615 [Chthoniobacterales bacterium]|jgi:hypothetical protein|nr:hypothetical protein [Chthoniobacterales bacterium]
MKRFSSVLAPALLCALAFSGSLVAQQRNQNQPNNQGGQPQPQSFPLWKAELPGGTYIVARNAINAVSSQEYVLDGVARVTEVNISTAGGIFQPRFYYLEMIATGAAANVPGAAAATDPVQPAAQSAADNAVPPEQQPWAKVVKNYPTTTHAGTIEFRMNTKEELQALFDSVERVWLTGKSEVYTPGGTRPFSADEELKNKDADSDKNGEGGPGSGAGSSGQNN